MNNLSEKEIGLGMFLQEVEFGFEGEIESIISDLSTFISSTLPFEFEIQSETNFFKVTINRMVERDNNVSLITVLEIMNKANLLFKKNDLNLNQVFLSIYIWGPTAAVTPQLSFSPQSLTLFSEMGLELDIVMYTYDPNDLS